jgi:hypothetical protein
MRTVRDSLNQRTGDAGSLSRKSLGKAARLSTGLAAKRALQTGGTCFGDSGGPDLLGGTNIVLAVNSYVTNGNCTGVTYSNRVDLPDILSFIAGI